MIMVILANLRGIYGPDRGPARRNEMRDWRKGFFILILSFFVLSFVLPADVLARVGGSRSFGSRGTRSAPAPSRSYSSPQPTQPSQSQGANPSNPAAPSQ